MDNNTITLETTIAYPAKWRMKDDDRIITFTIPCHSDLLQYITKPPKCIQCYYRNLRFKYGTLTKGTSIKLTAEIDRGSRGGIQLHVKELEVTGPVVQNLTKVNANMMKKWTKQFEKRFASSQL